MFTSKPSENNSGLENAIDDVFRAMADEKCDSHEYTKMIGQLLKLYSLKEIDSPKRVSPDTLAIVAGNLVGIVLILRYERLDVVTSKALSFILRLR